MNFNEKLTNRGFSLIEFKDRYNCRCSIQKSSLATEEAIWFGIDDPDPKIMASKVQPGGTGWVSYVIPDDVSITTRMHLTRDQVKELLPILEHFVATGEVAAPENQTINELMYGMIETLEMARQTLIRFEIDLDIANHALLGEISVFLEFVTKHEIADKQKVVEKALSLSQKVFGLLEELMPNVTDDNLFTDLNHYIEESKSFLEFLKKHE